MSGVPSSLYSGRGPEVVGLEAPGDFELAEIAGVDLIERRVLAAAQIGGVRGPLAVLRARLPVAPACPEIGER